MIFLYYTFSNYKKYKFNILLILLLSPLFVIAQERANGSGTEQKLKPMIENFTSFSKVTTSAYLSQWEDENEGAYKQHPEFGTMPFNGPSGDLVEVLEKRQIDSRYFINPLNQSEFIIQQAHGDLHYKKDGNWLTINPHLLNKGNGIFEADRQFEPVGFNISEKSGYIKTIDGEVNFNQWQLLGGDIDGNEVFLADADWSNYSTGDDGLFITNIFPGIDASMMVRQGAIKTNFIVKSLQFTGYKNLIFKDEFKIENAGAKLEFENISDNKKGADRVHLIANNKTFVEIGVAYAYCKNAPKDQSYFPEYNLLNNKLALVIPIDWIQQNLLKGVVIIDPLVSSTNSLAQAAIAGSRYDASCTFSQFCTMNLSVNTPPNATITRIIASFDYIAQGGCWMSEGAYRFRLVSPSLACVSPSGGYWTYIPPPPFFPDGPGQVTGDSLTLLYVPSVMDLAACLPPPSCLAQTLNFELQLMRCFGNTAGCSNTCIGAFGPWDIVIRGQTVAFTSPAPNQFNVSATSVCAGQNITATSLGSQYGVGPYTTNWSLSPTGIPSVGAGSPAVINFPTAGAYTLYCIITDACSQTSSANKAITITPPPAAPTVTSPVTYCQNASASILTATGNSLEWFTVPVGGSPTGAPTPATGIPGTTSYYVQQTVGGCVSARAQIDVVVNPFPTFGGGASATPASCGASDGSITGLTASGTGTITYVWSNTVPIAVSTTTTNADLSNQPAGNYNLTVTDANGCSNTYGPVVITSAAPPSGPVVTTPINYCLGATALALTATGTNLLWYTVPVGGVGSAIAPTPSTAIVGSTSYYVSQTVNGCESARIQIDVIINNAPVAPTVTSPINICQGATTSALSATGVSLLWYTVPVGGVGSAVAPTPSSASLGNVSYYVSQTTGGCESPRAQIIVQVNAPPVINGTASVTPSSCGQSDGAITGLSATGIVTLTYTWTNSILAVVSSSTTNATLNNQPAGTYTLTVTDAVGCSTTGVPVQITNNAAPAAPITTTPITYCQGDIANQLTATGTSLLWYTIALGGTGSATAPTPSTTLAGTVNYYVSQTVAGCESPLQQIDIITNATPAAPIVTTPVNYCQGATATALTATGNSLLWYTLPVGGTGSATAPTPSTIAAGTSNYYVTQTVSGCEGPNAQIVVQVSAAPVISGVPAVTPSNCGLSDGSISGYSVTGTGTLTYTWTNSTSVVISTSTTSPDLSNQSADTYTLTVTDAAGCSAVAAAQQITNIAAPSAPVVTSPLFYCIGVSTNTLTATGANLLWYTLPVGGVGSAIAPTPSSAVVGTVSYYVSQTVAGCESALAQIDVTVTSPPAAPAVISPVNLCLNTVASALTATGTTLLWYTVPIGGTGSSTAPIPSTLAIGTTSYYVSEVNNGCESVRAQIDVIINPLPAAPIVVTPISYCQGAVATALTATGTSLLWYTTLTGGSGVTTLTPQTSIAGDTSYYVSQSAGGCESPRSEIIVIINPSAVPEATITSSNTNVCEGTLISFSAIVNNAGSSPTMQWLLNNAPIPGQTGLNYSSSALTGNATISFQVNSTAVCANPVQIISNIINLNITPNATPAVIIIAEPEIVCTGQPITITATPLFGGASPNFIFRLNGVTVQQGSSNTFISDLFSDGDLISVIMNSNYACINGSNTALSNVITVEIAEPPTAEASASQDTIINGQSTLLIATTSSTNALYLWEPATYLVCDICETTNANPEISTTYLLTVTDISTGCIARDTVDVFVTNEFNIFIPTAFSPNIDGTNDELYVRGTGIKSFTLDIFDRWGMKIFTTSEQKDGWNGMHNDKPVVAGIYTYYLKYEKFDGTFGELKGNVTLSR